MRLALLAPLEYPLTQPYVGGLERHTVQLARGLAALGHELTLFARPGSEPLPGIQLVTDFTNYGKLLRHLRTADYDLLHNNTINFLPTLLSFRLPYPVVTTLHTPPYRRLLPGALSARVLGGASFVAISRHLARRWQRYTGPCTVIHNGIDPADWSFTSSAPACSALWYGRITPEKAPHLAILAARRAGYRIRLAGPVGDAAYHRDRLLPLLGQDAEYLGHLDQHALLPHMGNAAVGLFTSVWEEPFGLVIPELLACGTPVVGFASGAAPELVTDAVSRLVPVGDVLRLAEAIPQAAGLDRVACRTYAVDHFHVQKMIDAYHALYLRLTA
ncbi:Glycogen synthase [Neolewinella maritima]|uniref:Glycogen synthase n=1 Tax=Neolewinella maritima TaxID=1383882 RepID=A0ABM9B2L0_9BACT|nr:glycosyltransferase [Neolewinella maritima]CAH1001588.1 Glycogen synthase [Neolewinella maritima]